MWTRQNLIKISLVGSRNIIKCNCCGVMESFEQSDKFVEMLRPNAKNSRALKKLKTPKDFVAWFLDTHFYQHVTAVAEAEAATV